MKYLHVNRLVSVLCLLPVVAAAQEQPQSQSPQVLSAIAARYPAVARDNKVMGVVTVRVELDSKGNVAAARVLRGVPMLDRACLDAAQQWRFAEAADDTPRQVDLTFSFKLVPKTAEPGAAIFSLPSKVETRELWPEG